MGQGGLALSTPLRHTAATAFPLTACSSEVPFALRKPGPFGPSHSSQPFRTLKKHPKWVVVIHIVTSGPPSSPLWGDDRFPGVWGLM